ASAWSGGDLAAVPIPWAGSPTLQINLSVRLRCVWEITYAACRRAGARAGLPTHSDPIVGCALVAQLR
ncbi:MAG: hypothetical protein ABI273_10320, partial [Lacunisphaera sp.]